MFGLTFGGVAMTCDCNLLVTKAEQVLKPSPLPPVPPHDPPPLIFFHFFDHTLALLEPLFTVVVVIITTIFIPFPCHKIYRNFPCTVPRLRSQSGGRRRGGVSLRALADSPHSRRLDICRSASGSVRASCFTCFILNNFHSIPIPNDILLACR